MATQYQNLSDYDPDLLPPKDILEQQRYAIAVADWNPRVTEALLQGAIEGLTSHGVLNRNIEVIHVPGTFELTFAAKKFMYDNMEEKKYDAIIVLGCVIQGETPHFKYVCQGITQGITALNLLQNGCPVIYGILTTDNMQQALERSGGIHGNKGVEAAVTAIKMANL